MSTSTNKPFFEISEINSMCNETREQNRVPHIHDYFSIYWIQKGEALHATKYIQYTVKKNNVFFVPAGLTHSFEFKDNCRGFSIFFNFTFFNLKYRCDDSILRSSLFNNPDFYTIIQISKSDEDIFNFLFKRMLAQNVSASPYQPELLTSALMLLLYTSKEIHDKQYSDSSVSLENNPKRVVINFRQMLEENYKTAKDVSFYAEKLNVRPVQLNEIIKKITGITAGEFIRNKIIEEAKKMLYSTDLNTKEIGFVLGFDDPAYFSRFFKKYTGSTLSDFRTLLQKKVQ